MHFSFSPSSLPIGCCRRNAEKPVKHTSSTLGALIGEGLRLAAGYLPATSRRPRCPRARPWLLKQREDGVCATTTCATVITSTVGGLTPTMGLVVQLLAAVGGSVATPPGTHVHEQGSCPSQRSLLGYVPPQHRRRHARLASTSYSSAGFNPY